MKMFVFGKEIQFRLMSSIRYMFKDNDIVITLFKHTSGYEVATYDISCPYNYDGTCIDLRTFNIEGKNLEDIIGEESTIRLLYKTTLIPEKYKIWI